MKLYGAIDLHSNNNVTILIDEQGQVVYRKRAGFGVMCRLWVRLWGQDSGQGQALGVRLWGQDS